MSWSLLPALVVAALALGSAPAAPVGPAHARLVPVGAATAVTGARVPPVAGERVRPFVAPPHEYGPGHRGVDLPAAGGAEVVSPAAGVVTFAGAVAGRGVVVVASAGPGGLVQHSLEPVSAVVPVGAVVAAGEVVATRSPGTVHPGCGSACLHWGVRVAGRYVDPWWWLGRTGPVRLLPRGPDTRDGATAAGRSLSVR
ncbi:peptidoglycan DD-metalloendopeptidase family protein [Aquipuribacter nitratireducens]|uniref:Peptidoglycan DD-metalloendopeptidase family protein n=1 Tax=Aquipuribacter nitratireducens TaxID=650104 RepID=A0ABW0GLX9_9MICO